MATHVFPTFESNAQLTPTWVGLVFSGRASALFAVLAGIGLALSTGKQQPFQGPQLWAARRGIALRALVVGAVGLSLGGLEVNIAIILVHYAVLFLCVLPFLGLDVKHLLVLAAGWVLVSPALAFLLRPWLLTAEPPLQLGHNPKWEDLSTPAVLLGDLFLTGYYPVLQWIAYLLIGLAIGRLALTTAAVPVAAAGGGNRGGGPGQVAQRGDDGGLGRPGGAAGVPAQSLVSAGEPPAGQPGRRGPDRLRLVARLQCPAFGHHAGSAAHLGGGGRRRRRLPAAGPAGPADRAGRAAPAARCRRHDPELLHGPPVRDGLAVRPAAAVRVDGGGRLLGAGRGDPGPGRNFRGPGVAGAAGVGGARRQPARPLPAGPRPVPGVSPRLRPGGIPCGTAGRRRASRRAPACGRPRRHRRS